MVSKRDSKDRRKHVRFNVRQGAFATVSPDLSIVGPILNISKGGLAFRHNSIGQLVEASFELDILYLRHGYHLEKVPSKMVSYFDVTPDALAGSWQAKHCCIQFGELTEHQAAHLENFIQLYRD